VERDVSAPVTITAQNASVDASYYWREISDCPVNSKVQLLGAGGLPQYGQWDEKNGLYIAWVPMPKRKLHASLEVHQPCECCPTGGPA
jgi:hypothetical protein